MPVRLIYSWIKIFIVLLNYARGFTYTPSWCVMFQKFINFLLMLGISLSELDPRTKVICLTFYFAISFDSLELFSQSFLCKNEKLVGRQVGKQQAVVSHQREFFITC